MEGIDAYTNETILARSHIHQRCASLFIIIETFLYVCVSLSRDDRALRKIRYLYLLYHMLSTFSKIYK